MVHRRPQEIKKLGLDTKPSHKAYKEMQARSLDEEYVGAAPHPGAVMACVAALAIQCSQLPAADHSGRCFVNASDKAQVSKPPHWPPPAQREGTGHRRQQSEHPLGQSHRRLLCAKLQQLLLLSAVTTNNLLTKLVCSTPATRKVSHSHRAHGCGTALAPRSKPIF